ncbi:uncharacterized protein LOC121267278 [Juglans microcarpa x Juglans regia]|uniref:uncharacterized protein LOC121267278 n=1 Tax=Juglans microcarpa x Juglans regia TaxID=2249226 RepID=UPI001B7E98CE|nr:uncharacterized protein LOC121267278 [Juglans microcarpa x Juglans regia]
MFEKAKVEGLIASSSDHVPIMLYVRQDRRFGSRRQYSFKFEASWIKENECEEVIKTAWVDTTQCAKEPLVSVQKMLRECGGKLSSTFRRRDGERCQDIELLNKKIKELQDREGPHNAAELHILQQEVGLLLENEDIRWKQRAKRNWCSLGDKNTKFFHACVKQRRKKNQIIYVLDANSELKEGNEEVVEAFRQYYTEVYKTAASSCDQVMEGIQSIGSRVTE